MCFILILDVPYHIFFQPLINNESIKKDAFEIVTDAQKALFEEKFSLQWWIKKASVSFLRHSEMTQ